MNKKILGLLMAAALCLGIVGCGGSKAEEPQQSEDTEQTVPAEQTAPAETPKEEEVETAEPDEEELTEYSNEFFNINYDEDLFTLEDRGENLGIYTKLEDDGGHNTMLGVLVQDNDQFDDILESEIKEVNQMLSQLVCQGMFEVDEGVEIISESYDAETGYCMELSDGSKCYTRVMSYGRQMALAICRLCSYSESVNDKLYETYLTAQSLVKEEVPLAEEPADTLAEEADDSKGEVYSGGMYKIGTDMPAGEYLITSSSRAYIEVTSDSSGSLESIVSNDNFINRKYITVDEGQYLKFDGTAVPVEEAPAYTADVYPDGTYLVGKDIPAGEYKITATSGKGYVEITSDSYGKLESIISNDIIESSIYQTVSDGQYIKLSRAEIKAE